MILNRRDRIRINRGPLYPLQPRPSVRRPGFPYIIRRRFRRLVSAVESGILLPGRGVDRACGRSSVRAAFLRPQQHFFGFPQ
jgi:hypothetical protein